MTPKKSFKKTGCAPLLADRPLDVGWTSTQVSARITQGFLLMPYIQWI
jgi:hypothetical protein